MTPAICALAIFAIVLCFAMYRGWLITAIIFGLATLAQGCNIIGG